MCFGSKYFFLEVDCFCCRELLQQEKTKFKFWAMHVLCHCWSFALFFGTMRILDKSYLYFYKHIAVVSILDSTCLLQQWRCVDTQHAVKKIAIGSTCQWCLSELWRVCKTAGNAPMVFILFTPLGLLGVIRILLRPLQLLRLTTIDYLRFAWFIGWLHPCRARLMAQWQRFLI